jgi:hypothetical protein
MKTLEADILIVDRESVFADMAFSMIIGNNVLKKFKTMMVDFETGHVHIGGEALVMGDIKRVYSSTARMRIAKQVLIEPKTTMKIDCVADEETPEGIESSVFLSNQADSIDKQGLWVTPGLYCAEGKVLVSNPTTSPVTLHAGQTVGFGEMYFKGDRGLYQPVEKMYFSGTALPKRDFRMEQWQAGSNIPNPQ